MPSVKPVTAVGFSDQIDHGNKIHKGDQKAAGIRIAGHGQDLCGRGVGLVGGVRMPRPKNSASEIADDQSR